MARQFIDNGLTAKQLRSRLEYEPDTGMFIWRPRKPGGHWNTWHGRRAGAAKDGGYIVIRIDDRLYRANRLAWLYVYGRWPKAEVDHINHDPSDNRWSNLRLASSSRQKMNARRRSDNTSGVKGVWYDKRRNRWIAEIMANGKKHHLGQFATIEEAKAVRTEAACRLHGAFACFD